MDLLIFTAEILNGKHHVLQCNFRKLSQTFQKQLCFGSSKGEKEKNFKIHVFFFNITRLNCRKLIIHNLISLQHNYQQITIGLFILIISGISF